MVKKKFTQWSKTQGTKYFQFPKTCLSVTHALGVEYRSGPANPLSDIKNPCIHVHGFWMTSAVHCDTWYKYTKSYLIHNFFGDPELRYDVTGESWWCNHWKNNSAPLLNISSKEVLLVNCRLIVLLLTPAGFPRVLKTSKVLKFEKSKLRPQESLKFFQGP